MCYIELVIAFDGMLSEKLSHWVVSAMLAVLMQRLSVICLDNAVHGGLLLLLFPLPGAASSAC